MSSILAQVRAELGNHVHESTRKDGQRFFKEEILTYGVKVPVVNEISKKYFKQLKMLQKAEIFELCSELWQSGYIEESLVACHWSYAVRKQYEMGDFSIFAEWIRRYVNNWASCDTLCNHTMGTLLIMFPEITSRLKPFAASDNRWVRRAAAVSLVVPARRGLFLKDVLDIGDALLNDDDDLVQKGYGWMLKSAAEVHQKEVFEFVMARKSQMPRTALRYAIEKMPVQLKQAAMAK